MAFSTEAIHFDPVEEHFTRPTRPYLRLLVNHSVVLETLPGSEDEPTTRLSDRFKGRVAIEGLQAEYDAITELAELVDGQMRAPIELSFDGHDLYGPDGRSLTVTAENGLKAARENAKKNPNLWFEVGRRSLELEEIRQAVEMAKGNGPNSANTMLVTTDFPEVLRDAKEDVGGYNVIRQQALARTIVISPNGKIMLYSQTLDGSNRQALEAVHAEFGFAVKDGELLDQRRFLKLSAEEQATVMDRATNAYDRKMAALFGGRWYAGRRPVDYRNTYDFVLKQRDLLGLYKNLKLSGNLTSHVMYDLAATVNARFKKSKNTAETKAGESTVAYKKAAANRPFLYDAVKLYQEMTIEGRTARSEGKSFSACGSTWKAEAKSTDSLLEKAGFGSKAEAGGSWHGGKIYKNSKCLSCEKVKDEVGACRICKDCVKNPKKANLGTTQGRTSDPKKAKVNAAPARVYSLGEHRKAKQEKSPKDKNNRL